MRVNQNIKHQQQPQQQPKGKVLMSKTGPV